MIDKNPEKDVNLFLIEEPNKFYVLIELDKNLENAENLDAISNILK